MDDPTAFGALLRLYRAEAGLSQEALADRAGLSTRGLQKLERGDTLPYPATIVQLARALALTPEQRAQLQASATRPPRRGPAPRENSSMAGDDAEPPESPGWAERKQVTALVVDLFGWGEYLARHDPEEARQILDPVLERLTEVVTLYGGIVNQVQEDGLVALFGAPLAYEDHALRACQAALTMRDAVEECLLAEAPGQLRALRFRAGLDSGEVVIRSLNRGPGYQVIGESTYLAARTRDRSAPGAILLSRQTMQLVEGYAELHPRGTLLVDGQTLDLYELSGLHAGHTRFPSALGATPTPLVGRDAELQLLQGLLAQAREGRGQLVALVGEPGVGKTRLAWEVRAAAPADGWQVLHAAAVSYGASTPYRPVVELLRDYFGVEPTDRPAQVRARIALRVLGLDRALEPILPALSALLDVPVEGSSWSSLDPSERRRTMLEAGRRLLLRVSEAQPLLLVMENLHWIDSETQALLDSLVEALPTARLLLLVNYRPEYQHVWSGKSFYAQVRLDPLPAEQAARLLDALLGEASELWPLKWRLIETTEGNPFFLEECVRALREAGALEGEPGAFRLVRTLDSIQVPASVRAVLAARMDLLPERDKQLLQVASVVGKDSPVSILRAITDEPEPRLRQSLAHLHEVELMYQSASFPEPRYTFRHALTREVAYASLLTERRRGLHAAVLSALERSAVDRASEEVELLARHAYLGEQWEPAVDYLRQAGRGAAGRAAPREAARHFEQALAALRQLPEALERQRLEVDLCFDLRNCLWPLGELERGASHLHRARAVAEQLDDRARLARVLSHLTSYYWRVGDHERAVEIGMRTVALAESVGDLGIQVESDFRLAQVHYTRGDYNRSVAMLRRTLAALEKTDPAERFTMVGPLARSARCVLAYCLAELGELEEAAAYGEEAVRIAEAINQPWSLTFAHDGIGTVYLRRGAFEQAISLLERGLAVYDQWQNAMQFPLVAAPLGSAYTMTGRLREGIELMERAVAQAETIQLRERQAIRLVMLGEGYLMAGRPDDAWRAGERALELARRHHERGNEAWALHLLGEVAAQGSSAVDEVAEIRYREALALARELAMRPLEAHCRRGLGLLAARQGAWSRARTELGAAATQFGGLGMDYWAARAEAALGAIAESALRHARETWTLVATGDEAANAAEVANAQVILQWCRLLEGDAAQVLLCHEQTMAALDRASCAQLWALAAVAGAYILRGREIPSQQVAREALALAQEAKDRAVVPFAHAALALAYAAAGDISRYQAYARCAAETALSTCQPAWMEDAVRWCSTIADGQLVDRAAALEWVAQSLQAGA